MVKNNRMSTVTSNRRKKYINKTQPTQTTPFPVTSSNFLTSKESPIELMDSPDNRNTTNKGKLVPTSKQILS